MWKRYFWWIVFLLLIAYDQLIGISRLGWVSILGILLLFAQWDHNKRLEALEREAKEGFVAFADRLDRINDRLRWVEFWLFGNDREDMMSAAWSARQRGFRLQNKVDPEFQGLLNEHYKGRDVFRNAQD